MANAAKASQRKAGRATAPKEVPRKKKRAIALAGGGPAAGLHIGALEALEQHGVAFDVWSLSCIGAWVGVYYNQLKKHPRASQTHAFFREHAFRDSASYRGFPVNKAFAPHLQAYTSAWLAHSLSPQTYWNAFNFGNELPDVVKGWQKFLTTPAMWQRDGDVNAHVLNNILAVNPMSRYLTSLLYLSEINGLSNIYYKDSTFLEEIDFGALDLVDVEHLDQMGRDDLAKLAAKYDLNGVPEERKQVPEIYHNALPLGDAGTASTGVPQLFNNKWLDYRNGKRKIKRDYLPITRPSLCACSALPYVEQTVTIPNDDGRHYSEGALVDTVSFKNLVEDHPDLDEIWVCRIVDYGQVHLQKNLHDSLANLCEQFAAEVGENDISLFKSHLRKSVGRTPRVVEIPLNVKTKVNYHWDRDNLEVGVEEARKAVLELLEDEQLRSETTTNPKWELPE